MVAHPDSRMASRDGLVARSQLNGDVVEQDKLKEDGKYREQITVAPLGSRNVFC